MKFSWASTCGGTKETSQNRHQGPFLHNNPVCQSTLNPDALCMVRLHGSSFWFLGVSHLMHAQSSAHSCLPWTLFPTPPSLQQTHPHFYKTGSFSAFSQNFISEDVLIFQHMFKTIMILFCGSFIIFNKSLIDLYKYSYWQLSHYYPSWSISFWPRFYH